MWYPPMDECTMNPRVLIALLLVAAYATPADPPLSYMNAVVKICADIYDVDIDKCRCIIDRESGWNPNARGDKGTSVGLWQWKEKSIRIAFDDMGIFWSWRWHGDPRLNVWASTLAACHALSQGWGWWTTQELCEEILAIGELD